MKQESLLAVTTAVARHTNESGARAHSQRFRSLIYSINKITFNSFINVLDNAAGKCGVS
jgi:hypothetical protein